jgi:hypothetical protein
MKYYLSYFSLHAVMASKTKDTKKRSAKTTKKAISEEEENRKSEETVISQVEMEIESSVGTAPAAQEKVI